MIVVLQCLSMEEEELKQRVVDHVDILTDPVDEKHYKKDEVSLVYNKPLACVIL